jgi:hypothetical protein
MATELQTVTTAELLVFLSASGYEATADKAGYVRFYDAAGNMWLEATPPEMADLAARLTVHSSDEWSEQYSQWVDGVDPADIDGDKTPEAEIEVLSATAYEPELDDNDDRDEDLDWAGCAAVCVETNYGPIGCFAGVQPSNRGTVLAGRSNRGLTSVWFEGDDWGMLPPALLATDPDQSTVLSAIWDAALEAWSTMRD